MYYKRYSHYSKGENACGSQSNVTQTKDRIIKFRCGDELYNKYEGLAKELGQSLSKVVRDVSEDFFLDKELIEQKKDVEDFLN